MKNCKPNLSILYITFIFACLRAIDTSVTMDDEIYFALGNLETLNGDNDLLNSRAQIEIARFSWRNYKEPHSKFNL